MIIILSITNIVFSSFFVLTLNLNVLGVVLGTLIASYLTAILFSFYTYSFIVKKFQILPSFKNLIIPSKLLKLFTINFDIFIRTLFLTFSFLWITYLGSSLGEDYLAVNTILMQFIIIAAFFLDAYAFSTEGMVGFAIGKRNQTTFLSYVKHSIQLSFFTAIILSLFYILFFKQIINIITDVEILRFISYQHIIWIIIFHLWHRDGIFIGASQKKEMRTGMIISVTILLLCNIFNKTLW